MIVLVAPLDWGLGHATRCIPLIRALVRAGHTVIPCAGGAGARLLRAEFPHLTVEEVPGHAMTYTRRRALLPLWLLAQMPPYLLGMRREAMAARRLARAHGAGLIIADGRYGFRARGVPGVFVTHQLEIIPPGPAWLRALIAPALRALNARALRRFDEVWVPDFPGATNLSGALGHPDGARAFTSALSAPSAPHVKYIRPLCRFRPEDAPWSRVVKPRSAADGDAPPRLALLALISGPEPQRTLLEERLRAALAALPGTRVLVRGVPGTARPQEAARAINRIRPGELNVFDHLPGARLAGLIEAAENVVCRSGYTTMMELAGLGARRVLLVPTPGQPEQEYLAMHARARGLAAWRDQDELDAAGLNDALREAAALPGFGALVEANAQDGDDAPYDLAAWIVGHPLLRAHAPRQRP